MTLPPIHTIEDYRAVYADDSVWLPAMRQICAKHGLDASELRRQELGTHVVFRTGATVVKLFGPLWPRDHVAERAFLAHVRGLPIPELVGEGRLGTWPYLLMSVVPGAPAKAIWPALDDAARIDVIEQIGTLMRKLHASPPIAALATDWDALLRERVSALREHHPEGEPWRSQIIDRVARFEAVPFEPVVLSADVTDDHVLLTRIDGRWRITGFIDFGDAMSGDPAYEFVAPLTCFAAGAPDLSRRLVEAYGWVPTPDLTDRLTTNFLLHRYWSVAEYLERCPVPDLPALHASVWG